MAKAARRVSDGEISGLHKASILMLALGEEHAGKLFAMMHEDEIKAISGKNLDFGMTVSFQWLTGRSCPGHHIRLPHTLAQSRAREGCGVGHLPWSCGACGSTSASASIRGKGWKVGPIRLVSR